MTTSLKPSRVLWLAVACATLFAALAITAPQAGAHHDSSAAQQGKSLGCSLRYNPKDSASYACFRVIAPVTVTVGVPFEMVLKFKARRALRNVTLRTLSTRIRWKRKWKYVRKGREIVKRFTITLPPLPPIAVPPVQISLAAASGVGVGADGVYETVARQVDVVG